MQGDTVSRPELDGNTTCPRDTSRETCLDLLRLRAVRREGGRMSHCSANSRLPPVFYW